MRTKRAREGYVLIDHRNSPGISREFIARSGIDAPAVAGGTAFESAIAVCNHCHSDVILNPDRSRPREWCPRCDSYICDTCAAARRAGAACVTAEEKLARLFTAALTATS